MEMQVKVAVQVPHLEPCSQNRLHLGLELPVDLGKKARLEIITPAGPHRIAGKVSLGIHQAGNGVRRQDRPPLDQGEMHPETEFRKSPGQGQGLGGGRGGRHQAGAPEHPGAVGQSHRGIQGRGQAEIVSGEDDPAG